MEQFSCLQSDQMITTPNGMWVRYVDALAAIEQARWEAFMSAASVAVEYGKLHMYCRVASEQIATTIRARGEGE